MNPSNLLEGKALSTLKGVGDKTEKLFGKVGIYDLGQLVHYYPRAYDLYSDCVGIGDLVIGKKQSVLVFIKTAPIVKKSSRVPITVLNTSDDGASLAAIWFNMPYLRSILKIGTYAVLRGTVGKKNNRLIMEHPEIFTEEAYEKIQGSIQPVYALTAGLKNKAVSKAVRQVFDRYSFFDYLPEDIIRENDLQGRDSALNGIHFPQNEQRLKSCRKRIVFDEFLFFLLRLKLLKSDSEKSTNEYRIRSFEFADKIIEGLPFELTCAQKRVWNEICADLSSKKVMNRLIQGDVGSGKTIIAFLAALSFAEVGFQSAVMAPTEILARQHYDSLIELMQGSNLSDEGVILLTGSLSAAQKRDAYKKIADKTAKIIIGTHAIIQSKVEFDSLALVITDEQHRFGVEQRRLITEKGRCPHVLIMSATPIPRTLAIILYGDLKISVIDELPARRLKIKNCVVDTSYRKTAYTFMKREIQSGRQVYIICPMIEPNEDFPCENVTEYTAKLKHIFSKDINVSMLHGRMSSDEKNKIMTDFVQNRIQILVSTTVIEVGINVPNATVMLIENAERFGLAQLHQLRGRIGRGEHQSYCIFMQGTSCDETNKRLEILNDSNDGFYIAKEDLRLRGQGDLFGLRQSGEAGFSLANPFTDAEILRAASQTADKILLEDADLQSEKYALLSQSLNQLDYQSDGIL